MGRVWKKLGILEYSNVGFGYVGYWESRARAGSGLTFRVSGITSGITYHEFGYFGTFSGIINNKCF